MTDTLTAAPAPAPPGHGLSPLQEFRQLPPDQQRHVLAHADAHTLAEMEVGEWWWTARPAQRTPPGNWTIWLLRGGRGVGKTRVGAEWIVEQAITYPHSVAGHPTNWLVIGETLTDVRTFCIEGESGILAVLRRRRVPFHYTKAPKPIITLTRHGQVIYFEGADDEDTGRGYNLAGAWCDELGKWRHSHAIWTKGLLLSLRTRLPGGGRPRCVVTTTPKPIRLLRAWDKRIRQGDPYLVLSAEATYANADNLSAEMLAEFEREYAGTSLGRQELGGEQLDEVEGALWALNTIERHRVKPGQVPELVMTVVAVDPANTGKDDEMGLVAAGRGVDDDDYVLRDWSAKLAGKAAVRRAWELFREVGAAWMIYEDNNLKLWIAERLVDVYAEMQAEGLFPPGGYPPLMPVHATVGKRLRAEPSAMRYEQGRVHHVGIFHALEDEQVTWVPDAGKDSPNRIDAVVHALAYLRGREQYRTEVAVPGGSLPRSELSPLG